jgi:beta-glucosidase
MKETVAPAVHGLDVEMPGPGAWWGDGKLQAAVERGEVDEALLDDKVRRILGLLAWRDRLPGVTTTADERSLDRAAHRALARRAAAESMVLIKNDGLLPLAPERSIALIGPGAVTTALLGGGSASLQPHPSATVLEALTSRWSAPVQHATGVDLRRRAETVSPEWIGPEGVTIELHAGRDLDGEPFAIEQRARTYNVWFGEHYPVGHDAVSLRVRFTLVPRASGPHRLVGSAFGRARLFVDGELAADSEVDGFPSGFGFRGGAIELDLHEGEPLEVVLEAVQPTENTMRVAMVDVGIEPVRSDGLDEAAAVAAAADVAVVVVGSNEEWESEGADRESLELPAGQDELVRRVRAANPDTVVVLNCGAPMLLPWLDDVPAVLLSWYPGQEGGEAIVDVLTGAAEPGGRMPTTWPREERHTPSFLHYPGGAGVVRYGEELHVGHRWYDARGLEPRIPFGHGGSYTQFEWGEPEVHGTGTAVTVDVPITNVGDRFGSEVVQLYVAAEAPVVLRPPKQLAGFAKVRLAPGGRTVARIELDEVAFRRWEPALGRWVVDDGRYDLVLARSAIDVRSILRHRISAPS